MEVSGRLGYLPAFGAFSVPSAAFRLVGGGTSCSAFSDVGLMYRLMSAGLGKKPVPEPLRFRGSFSAGRAGVIS